MLIRVRLCLCVDCGIFSGGKCFAHLFEYFAYTLSAIYGVGEI